MGVTTIEQHDEMIFDYWNDTVTKRDVIFILGDIGYNFEPIKKLPGHKRLLLGNHDKEHVMDYLQVFDEIIGPIRYKQHWLSHFPIHESELWGKPVIHGHTHGNGVADARYVNVCVEFTRGKPVSYQDIVSGYYKTHDKVNKTFETIDWS